MSDDVRAWTVMKVLPAVRVGTEIPTAQPLFLAVLPPQTGFLESKLWEGPFFADFMEPFLLRDKQPLWVLGVAQPPG